jgi:hypothetical protein
MYVNNVLFNYLTSFVIGNYIFAQIPPGKFRVRISHLHNTTRDDLTSQEVGFVRDATLWVCHHGDFRKARDQPRPVIASNWNPN